MRHQFLAEQADMLKEVGNIGAGHAVTALSQLLNRPIKMTVPSAKMIPFAHISDSVGGDENVIVAVYLRVYGDVSCNLFLIMSSFAADALLQEVLGQRSTGEPFNEMERSAIMEIGNILAGSYLSSLTDFTSLNMSPSVPSLTMDMAGAVLSYGLIQAGAMGDYAVMIDTAFDEGEKNEVQAHFFLIPDPESLDKIFHTMGVPTT